MGLSAKMSVSSLSVRTPSDQLNLSFDRQQRESLELPLAAFQKNTSKGVLLDFNMTLDDVCLRGC